MAEENKPVVPPVETPAAGVPEAEVNSRIEKARKEEKEKLYAEIQSLNAKLEESGRLSTTQIADLQKKFDEKVAQLEAIGKAKTSSGEIDVPALIRETAETATRAVSTAKDAEIGSLRSRVDELDRVNKQNRLDSIKQSLISAAKGRIIAAMVTGDTEDALKASAEQAKVEYERIAVEAGASRASNGNANPPPPIKNPPGGPPSDTTTVDGFKRTGDAKSYGQRRDALMAGLKSRFG